jgi:hypothetical protein
VSLQHSGLAKRIHQLREEVSPEIAKTSAIGVSLAYLIGESYDFVVYRVVQGVFPGGIRLKMRFGIADSQVDALFRFQSDNYCTFNGKKHGKLKPTWNGRKSLL